MPLGLWVPRSRAAMAAGASGAVFLLLLLLRLAGAFQGVELAVYDHRIRQLASSGSEVERPVVLVLIGEQDILRHGHPLPDRRLAELIRLILASEPRAVGIDLYRDLPVPRAESGEARVPTPAYVELGRVVSGDPRVVMVMKLADADGVGTPAPSFLSDASQIGLSDLVPDPGGAIRHQLLFAWEGDRPLLSFSLQLALRLLAGEGVGLAPAAEDPDWIKLGATVIPPFVAGFGPYERADDGDYQFLLDYGMGDADVPAFSLSDVLEGKVDPAALRDKVVLVGTAAVSVKDSFHTPLRPATRAGGTLYGVEVHAHAVEQLARYARGQSDPLVDLPPPAVAAWLALWCGVGAALALLNRSLLAMVASFGVAVVLLAASGEWAMGSGVWIPVAVPLLGVVNSAAFVVAGVSVLERAERREVLGLFSRFQGPAVAEEIWRHREEFLGPTGRPVSRRVVLTALMSDLEGYTAASEKMEPQALMSWIDEYMNAMAQLVEEHGGAVDDYAGDGIKANFGFPVASEGDPAIDADAGAAVRCALAMGERMEALNRSWRERDLPTGRCRVGIFTGPAVVGCIGGDRSLKLTSVGDTVNTAARLESFHKDEFLVETGVSDWRVLIGEETMRRTQGLFAVESIGEHALKGKGSPVAIYRVLGASSVGAPSDP
jgi:adenylate cyclase